MTHDPLCPGWFDTLDGQMECDACELIAKVRADKREFCSGMWIGWAIGTACLLPVIIVLAVKP